MDILAVIMATLYQFVFGMLWYSPLLLGMLWAKKLEYEDGVSEIGLRRFNPARAKLHITALLTAVSISIVLDALLSALASDTLRSAITWALGLWAVFIALPTLTEYRYSKRSLVIWAIDQGYYLIAVAGSAVVIVLL